MVALKIIRELFTILFGVGAIVAAIAFEAEDPWLYILGVALICWGAWDIYKECRDSSRTGDVADMAKQRDEIAKRLNEKE